MHRLLPDDQAGFRPGSRPTSFASPKDVGEKRRPRRWRSATRTPRVPSTGNGKRPKLAALRQRTLLYPFPALATRRHQRGFTATATATATATVAARNVKDNRNGNGNGNGSTQKPKIMDRASN